MLTSSLNHKWTPLFFYSVFEFWLLKFLAETKQNTSKLFLIESESLFIYIRLLLAAILNFFHEVSKYNVVRYAQ